MQSKTKDKNENNVQNIKKDMRLNQDNKIYLLERGNRKHKE